MTFWKARWDVSSLIRHNRNSWTCEIEQARDERFWRSTEDYWIR